MVVDILPILQKEGNSIVEQIRRNLESTGTNATGRTSRSLRYEVRVEADSVTLKIIGRPFFKVVETGRKPTRSGASESEPNLVEQIKEWIAAKGIPGNAYAIAKSIHQKGTKLFQSGGRDDVYSNVVNEDLVARISQDVLDKFAQEYLKNAVNIFTNGSRVN